MARAQRNEFPDFKGDINELNRFFDRLPRLAGNVIVNFTKDRFRRQGYHDKAFQKWKPRKRLDRQDQRRGSSSRAILVQSGRLRRSIRIVDTTPSSVTVGTDVKYARIHNEGGTVQHPGGTAYLKVDGKTIWISNKAAAGKDLPRTRPHNITIPQRKFIGDSALLQRRLTALIQKSLKQIANK